MQKTILKALMCICVTLTQVSAQNNKPQQKELNKTLQQPGDSLKKGWQVKEEPGYKGNMSISSPVIDLEPGMTTNDPPQLKGVCEITIKQLSRVSPDSIQLLRKRNKVLRANLPPQNSKDNLTNWYEQNKTTLTMLDSEPTHYDADYSYKITCNRLPKNKQDIEKYNKVMAYLNTLYRKYND